MDSSSSMSPFESKHDRSRARDELSGGTGLGVPSGTVNAMRIRKLALWCAGLMLILAVAGIGLLLRLDPNQYREWAAAQAGVAIGGR